MGIVYSIAVEAEKVFTVHIDYAGTGQFTAHYPTWNDAHQAIDIFYYEDHKTNQGRLYE